MAATLTGKAALGAVRSCIGCGAKREKYLMKRIVRTANGAISLDPKGTAPGRGAYVCSLACFERARKKGRLARSFKAKVEPATYDEIWQELSRVSREGE